MFRPLHERKIIKRPPENVNRRLRLSPFKKTWFTCLLLGSFSLLVLPFSGHAEEPVVEIDKIVITAPKESPNIRQNIPVHTLHIRSNTSHSQSVGEVLEKSAGLHITRYGGLESATSISIRGSSRNQVTLFMDGIPLESASDQGIGIEHLSVWDFRKIEVFKTITPLSLGDDSSGGTLNLVSAPTLHGWHHRYALGMGSFFTITGSADVSYGNKKNDFALSMNLRRSNGDYSYLDNNGTPFNSRDDSTTERQNNQSRLLNPSFSWNHRFDSKHALSFATKIFRLDAGVPGLETFQSDTASRSLTEWLGRIHFSRNQAFANRGNWKNALYWRIIQSQFSDLNGEIGLGAGQDNDDKTLILGNRLTGNIPLLKWLDLNALGEYRSEVFYPTNFLAARHHGTPSHRQQIVLGIEPNLSFFSGDLSVSTQVRLTTALYDINNDDTSLVLPGTFFSKRSESLFSGGLSARYALAKGLYFKASTVRSARLPKFSEMFGDQGYILGNPSLTAEKALKFDGGLTYTHEFNSFLNSIHLEGVFFENHFDDLIQFELANGLSRANNFGGAESRGVELTSTLKFRGGIAIGQNYTFQKTKDTATRIGNALIGRPEHEFNFFASYTLKGLEVNLGANFIDNQFLDSLNTRKIDNRLRLDADVSYRFKNNYLLGFELKNITNSQIVDAVGFPLPGRSCFGRIEVSY